MSILLVHGAWHGAWCWSAVLAELGARGVEAQAIDLPGHGSQRARGQSVRLDDYAGAVVAAAATMTRAPLLVGHSMGGMVISAAAEREPAAFQSLFYLAAFLPQSGQSLAELAQRPGDGARGLGHFENGEVRLEREAARGLFYHDCDPDLSDWALDRLQPQPVGPIADPVQLTPERYGRLERDYLVCANDRAINPTFQREMAGRANCRDIVEVHSGHSPFLACPARVADILVESARGA
jgi:pimeloyl-ACP methyl ester carboxylesterase